MKFLGIGWFLIIILAVLQYNFKKERLYTQYLGKNGMNPNEKWDESHIKFEQECRIFQSNSRWGSICNCLESLEKKTSIDE